MTDYCFDEGRLELPGAGWVDRTVHVLACPAESGHQGDQLGFVITREPCAVDADLGALVDRQIKEQSRELRGFALLGQRDAEVGGAPAREVKFHWRHEAGMMFHYQAFVRVGATLMVLTASMFAKHAETCEARMSSVLASLRFRER
jgi:hypothetical protein